MVDNRDNRLERIRQLNLEVRRRLELAEASIGAANAVSTQLAAAEFLNEQRFLGDVTLILGFSVNKSSAFAEVIQAALGPLQSSHGAKSCSL